VSIDPKFKTLGSFDDGDTLSRQLVQQENNIDVAFKNTAGSALPKLLPTQTKTAAYNAALDELINAAGTFTVKLPIALPQNAGRVVGIVLTTGTVTVMTASTLVQGAATDVLTAAGAYLYTSDGVGWWRHAGVMSVTGGSGISVTGTAANPIVSTDGTAVTSAALSLAVQPIRLEMENLRHLILRLVQIEMGAADLGGAADNLRGSEQLNA